MIVGDKGNCKEEDVKVGAIRKMLNRLYTTWVFCPVTAANKIIQGDKLQIGWSVARVELLRPRLIQCYKCWHFGHFRSHCNSTIDRTGLCFKCSKAGHPAKNCNSQPRF